MIPLKKSIKTVCIYSTINLNVIVDSASQMVNMGFWQSHLALLLLGYTWHSYMPGPPESRDNA
jgi:hypothetical protein